MRSLLLALSCLLIIAAGSAPATAQTAQIAVVVNEDVITQAQLEQRLRLALVASGLRPTAENLERLRPQVLQGLIDESLQLQEADRLGISVGGDAVERAIADIAQRNNVGIGQFLQALQQAGVQVSTLEQQLYAQLAWREVIRSRIVPSVRISAGEIDDRLAQARAMSGQREYLVSEIFLFVDQPGRDAEVRALAQELVSQLLAGAPFPAVAAQFSQGASAAQGGSLGWVAAGQLEAEIGAALQVMQPGQISNPIRTGSGYHILALRDTRTAASPGGSEETLSLARLVIPFAEQPTQAVVERELQRAREASSGVNSCQGLRNAAASFGTEDLVDAGSGRLADLPEDLRGLVSGLPVNVPSDPQVLPDGIAVFMVCEREAAGDDGARGAIEEQIANERIDLLQRRLLRDLRSAAFIDIRV